MLDDVAIGGRGTRRLSVLEAGIGVRESLDSDRSRHESGQQLWAAPLAPERDSSNLIRLAPAEKSR